MALHSFVKGLFFVNVDFSVWPVDCRAFGGQLAKADADSTKVTDIDSLTVSAAVLGGIRPIHRRIYTHKDKAICGPSS